MLNNTQVHTFVVHGTAACLQVTLIMSQDLFLEFCNGLGRVTTTEADLFWQTLASLKTLRSFGMQLACDAHIKALGIELFNSISMLTQIR